MFFLLCLFALFYPDLFVFIFDYLFSKEKKKESGGWEVRGGWEGIREDKQC